MENSILEVVGVEIIGVMGPVSICMFLVVLLVYNIVPQVPDSPVRTAATLMYQEKPTDSNVQKVEGALLDAGMFILLITGVTFLLVLLYYYKFTNFLKNYMRFSAFFVLASMGGSIFLSIIQYYSIPVDSISCFILLFNFSVVGILSMFSDGFPILFRQVYMVLLGIFVAAWFTKLPELTTWILLLALACYDFVAVLAPGGPLKMLVDLASSRNEELPALIYEARPTVSHHEESAFNLLVGGVSELGRLDNSQSQSASSVELQPSAFRQHTNPEDQTLLLEDRLNSDYSTVEIGDEIHEIPIVENNESERNEETSPLVNRSIVVTDMDAGDGRQRAQDGRFELSTSRGIRLGLGDFVFYSVLVGRAAMYDLMTMYACYLAIVSGLGCTLILLSVCHRALPALPISITLGVLFYILTRLLMEPFVVGISTNLMMF